MHPEDLLRDAEKDEKFMENQIYCGAELVEKCFPEGEDWSTMWGKLHAFKDLNSAVAAYWLMNPAVDRCVLEK